MTSNASRLLILASASALLLAPSPLRALDWPNFQGPQRNGTSLETGLNLTNWRASGPKVLWEASFEEGFGGAAVQGDEVFVVDRDGAESDRLICLSLDDGKEKWQFSYDYPGSLPYPGSRGVPLAEEDAVYFVGGFGQVFRVNRETQEADWVLSIQDEYGAEPPRWGWAQSPVVVGDVLVVPAMAEDVGLIGIDKATGKEIWRTEGFGNSHSTPTVIELQGVEQLVFVGTRQEGDEQIGTTLSVLPATGEVLWQTDLYFNRIPIPFPTKVTEELVFLTGGYGDGSCMVRVEKREGAPWSVELVWEVEHGTQIHPPFVIDGHLYLLANENANHQGEARLTGGLMCMDFDGNILWQTGDAPFMGRGNMVLAEGHLLIQDGEVGYLRVVKPSPGGYEEVALADVFGKKKEVEEQIARQENREVVRLPDFKYWSPMALSQGRLLMRGQETLKCLDLR